jgi:hypothetical protein
MLFMKTLFISTFVFAIFTAFARADVGDPQIRTDHPWYPGELACSTFDGGRADTMGGV